MSEAAGDEVNHSDVEFIDDEQNVVGQNPSDCCLMNVTKDLQEALTEQTMSAGLVECSDPENFVPDYVDEAEWEYDEFKDYKSKLKNLEKIWKFLRKTQKTLSTTPFFMEHIVPCYTIRKSLSSVNRMLNSLQCLDKFFFGELQEKKYKFQLDLNLSNFQMQCHVINDILMNKKLFLWVYELRKKFRYLIKKVP